VSAACLPMSKTDKGRHLDRGGEGGKREKKKSSQGKGKELGEIHQCTLKKPDKGIEDRRPIRKEGATIRNGGAEGQCELSCSVTGKREVARNKAKDNSAGREKSGGRTRSGIKTKPATLLQRKELRV